MTSYPRHMTDKIIHQMAALPKVCEHVNIPVQHGDDGMLQRMRRGYTIGEYRDLIEQAARRGGPASRSRPMSSSASAARRRRSSSTRSICSKRFASTWCMWRCTRRAPARSPSSGKTMCRWRSRSSACTPSRKLQERIARELNAPYVGRTDEVLVEQRQVAQRPAAVARTQPHQQAGLLPGDEAGARPSKRARPRRAAVAAWRCSAPPAESATGRPGTRLY